jgi:hypothetical protein
MGMMSGTLQASRSALRAHTRRSHLEDVRRSITLQLAWWFLPDAVMQPVDTTPKGRVRTKPLPANPFNP